MSQNYSIESLTEKLKDIVGHPHPCTRAKNDGGAGNLLEDLLGIEENNLRLPDFGKIEIKTQRHESDSLLTLFHKEPTPPRSVPKLLKSMGWRHAEAGSKYPENEMSFRSTTYGHRYSSRGFRLVINQGRLELDFDPTQIDTSAPDRTGIYSTYGDWYQCVRTRQELHYEDVLPVGYDLKELKETFEQKIDHTLLVLVRTSTKNGIKYHQYCEALIMSGLNFNAVLDALENGQMALDFDARTRHNHGTKFRISKSALRNLFENFAHVDI